jgi:acetate kinase
MGTLMNESNKAILVLNAGSSSTKFSVFRIQSGDLQLLAHGQVEGIGTHPRSILTDSRGVIIHEEAIDQIDHEQALGLILTQLKSMLASHELVAVGHRIVHGGMKFTSPVRIDDEVLKELENLIPLAPLHQPHNLAAIRTISRLQPSLPQVACFDTAFHRTQPWAAQQFGLPRRFTDEGIRRYGFHGLSYEYIASTLPEIDAKAASGKTIVAHLGNGASLCAMLAGKSIATTMSFTPVDGLLMGTRVGSLDPAALLYLMHHHGMDAKAIEHLLYHESGLLGVSDISSDMRELLASEDPRAREAMDLFVYRISREIGSLVAALGGLDAFVFTAGIGEHSPEIRAAICEQAAWLGVEIDESLNQSSNQRITVESSKVAVYVIPANEELMIGRQAYQMLKNP